MYIIHHKSSFSSFKVKFTKKGGLSMSKKSPEQKNGKKVKVAIKVAVEEEKKKQKRGREISCGADWEKKTQHCMSWV